MSWLSDAISGTKRNAYISPDVGFLNKPADYQSYSDALSKVYDPVTSEQTSNSRAYADALSADIDKNTNMATGSGIGGFARRGLINPNAGGITSDIASVGLGNIAAQGASQKNQLGLQLQQNQLDTYRQLLTQAMNQAQSGQQSYADALMGNAANTAKYQVNTPGTIQSAFQNKLGEWTGKGMDASLNWAGTKFNQPKTGGTIV
jgi:hypothetical protein